MRRIRRGNRFMFGLGGAAGLLLWLLLFFMLDISSTGAQEPTATAIEEPTIIITVTVIPSTPEPTAPISPTAPSTPEPTTPPTITATTPPPTDTVTPEPTDTVTPEPTTLEPTATLTATETPTGTITPSPTPTATATLSPTLTTVPTVTETSEPTATVTPTLTATVTPTAIPTATLTMTPTAIPTDIPTAIPTVSATPPMTGVEPPTPREPGPVGAGLPRTLSVIGQGAIVLETELVQVEIGVEAVRPLMQEAQGAVQEQMTQVLAALREQGVADADIQTAGVEVRYEPAPGQEGAQAGYRVIHTLQVTLRDPARAPAILDAAAAGGASRIAGLRFRLDDQRAWETQALVQALDDAEARARQMAAYYGLELGGVVQIRQLAPPAGEEAPPIPVARHIPLDESVLTPPGRVQLSVQVEVVFAIRN